MFAFAPARGEFQGGQSMRIDFAAEPIRETRKQSCEAPESEFTNDHEIDVALRLDFSTRDGAKDERDLDSRVIQGFGHGAGDSSRLEHQFLNGAVQWMSGIGAIIEAVSISAGGEQAGCGEVPNFLLDGGQGETRSAGQFTKVEFGFAQIEQEPKDLSFATGRNDFEQVHGCLFKPYE